MNKIITSSTKIKTLQTSADVRGMRFVVLMAMLTLGCSGAFAQSDSTLDTTLLDESFVSPAGDIAAIATDSQLELVMWFMGTKQHRSLEADNNSSTIASRKKQFINCGVTPNRILSRTFMKKAINYDSTIA